MIIKTKTAVKYYILAGILLLNIPVTILFLKSIQTTIEESNSNFYLFYIGSFLENICFTLAIGFKQKLIKIDRDNTNEILIKQMHKNDILKEQIQIELQEKVASLNQQIKLKEEIDELILQSLRSQMNPHFIFNALNSIKHYIINNEIQQAALYLTKFSKLIRKILEASNVSKTSLREELENTILYITLENMRFENEIDFKIKISDKVNSNSIKIPPLILQPFIENAIWHGLSSTKNVDKKIEISIENLNNEFIEIIISDNGIGRKASEKIKAKKTIKRKSLGINLTKERLRNFVKNLKNDFSIVYEDIKDANNKISGTKVFLKIPLL